MSVEVLTRNTTSLVLNGRPIVRAATNLRRNSATELIDVNFLAQKRSSVIQYIEVADAQGRLYCVNASVNPSCWVKIIKLADGYQSCNVMLMMSGNGIVLKIIKPIIPGEPLLLWFSISILALVNIPFLMPINMPGAFMYPPFNDNYRLHFQGEINCYVCHICNSRFEFPNHLKLHLAFKCNTPNYDHLWIILAREFNMIPESCRIIETFIPDESLFGFNLSTSIQIVPIGTSPYLMEMTNSHSPNINDSQSSSNPSPSSSTHVDSPSPNSSIHVLPMHTKLGQYHSAFKPYMKNQDILPPRVMDHLLVSHDQYQIQPPAVRPDLHAAHMETIVSNLGKSKQGHLCIYCGKVYSRKYGLKIHIRTHTGYKPLKCKYCLRSFGDPSNLNKHVRLHAEGETPYKCDICGKVLVRRRDLERHIKSRHENVDQVSDTFPEDIDVVTQ